jgi:bacteriorhodopsin
MQKTQLFCSTFAKLLSFSFKEKKRKKNKKKVFEVIIFFLSFFWLVYIYIYILKKNAFSFIKMVNFYEK